VNKDIVAIDPFISGPLDDLGLDPYSFRVLCRVWRRDGTPRKCFESVEAIAAGCKMSPRSVQRALRRLCDLGLIRQVQAGGGRGRSAVYERVPVEEWSRAERVTHSHGLSVAGVTESVTGVTEKVTGRDLKGDRESVKGDSQSVKGDCGADQGNKEGTKEGNKEGNKESSNTHSCIANAMALEKVYERSPELRPQRPPRVFDVIKRWNEDQGISGLLRVQQNGEWRMICPRCSDNGVTIGRNEKGEALVKAHCGCRTEQFLHALSCTMADLYPQGHLAGLELLADQNDWLQALPLPPHGPGARYGTLDDE
jgi:Helix-turn-helix domain